MIKNNTCNPLVMGNEKPIISRQKTALKRHDYSRPINSALNDGLIDPSKSLFDYGCGHGDDINLLIKRGIQAIGWDPELRPSDTIQSADVVNLGYVINVIEDQFEREATLKKAWNLLSMVQILSSSIAKNLKYHTFHTRNLIKSHIQS
ncbi:hypothetical protein ACFL2E_03065 [Thermodesulfobacteriota bacterium]